MDGVPAHRGERRGLELRGLQLHRQEESKRRRRRRRRRRTERHR